MTIEQIKNAINKSKSEAGKADIPIRYFDGRHDILDNRIMMYNDQGQLVESIHSSNIKLSHPFFTQLVKQSTDFIFGDDIQFKTEDKILEVSLQSYVNSKTHQLLYEVVEEASTKGKEWVHAYKDNSGLVSFMRIDSRQIAEIVNEYGEQEAVIRYRKKEVTVWYRDGKIEHYKKDEKSTSDNEYKLVEERVHTIYDEKTGEVVSGFGRIPFFKLKNNRKERSDIELIKHMLDDYDRMASYASNDLQDFRANVHIFNGPQKVNMGKTLTNINATGGVSLKSSDSYEVKSNNVSIEQRQNKMKQTKEDIYEIGSGFNSTTTSHSNGNVTNVALKAGQQNLRNKVKGKMVYINVLLEWMLELILEDMEQRGISGYTVNDIEIEYTLGMIENELEKAKTKKTEEETNKIKIDTLLSIEHLIDEDTMLEEISKILDIDHEEVKAQVRMDGYGESLIDIVDAEVNE